MCVYIRVRMLTHIDMRIYVRNTNTNMRIRVRIDNHYTTVSVHMHIRIHIIVLVNARINNSMHIRWADPKALLLEEHFSALFSSN